MTDAAANPDEYESTKNKKYMPKGVIDIFYDMLSWVNKKMWLLSGLGISISYGFVIGYIKSKHLPLSIAGYGSVKDVLGLLVIIIAVAAYTAIVPIISIRLLGGILKNEQWINYKSSTAAKPGSAIFFTKLIPPLLPSVVFTISLVIRQSHNLDLVLFIICPGISTVLASRCWLLPQRKEESANTLLKLFCYFVISNLWVLFFALMVNSTRSPDIGSMAKFMVVFLISTEFVANIAIADLYFKRESKALIIASCFVVAIQLAALLYSGTASKLISWWFSVQIDNNPCVILQIQSPPDSGAAGASNQPHIKSSGEVHIPMMANGNYYIHLWDKATKTEMLDKTYIVPVSSVTEIKACPIEPISGASKQPTDTSFAEPATVPSRTGLTLRERICKDYHDSCETAPKNDFRNH